MPDRRAALVTGGAVRLGRGIVEELASRGWAVIFTFNSSRDAAEGLAASLRAQGKEVETLAADLSEPSAWRGTLEAAVERLGRLDALVNNAAAFPATPVDNLTREQLEDVLRLNLEAPLFLTLEAAAHLRRSRGAVVNLADIYARHPMRDFLAYCVSKAALVAATRALAVELAPEVRVNAVAPGIALFPESTDEETRRRRLARTPMGREAGAAEIARAVCYLIEDTEVVTGQVLAVDGGRTVVLR
jgi:pteridine reductase